MNKNNLISHGHQTYYQLCDRVDDHNQKAVVRDKFLYNNDF